jgi:DNA-binding IclR family transcriptional regulator
MPERTGARVVSTRSPSDKSNGAPSYRAPAVARALALIEFLADSPEPQKLSTIARELGAPKSSCFTILSTLETAGYVRQDEGDDAWALTLRLYYLGMKTAEAADVVPIAEPLLERLRDKTRMTTHLGLIDDSRTIRYALKVNSQNFVRFDTDPGTRASLHLTAIARAILANLPRDARDNMLRGYRFEGGTERAFRSKREFDAELDLVRERGFALEDQEDFLGVRCIAAPVFASGDRCIGAVGVLGLVAELDDVDGVAKDVVRTAKQLSGKL